jgi:DNA-binding CsgD family transcriptional regulator
MTHLILIQPDQSFFYRQITTPAYQLCRDFQVDGRLPDYIKADLAVGNTDVNYSTLVWKDWVIALPAETEVNPSVPSRLTRRQLDVLVCFSQGMTGKQVANRLNISQRSVSLHTSALKRSLAASTVAECVQKAARLGILNRADELLYIFPRD